MGLVTSGQSAASPMSRLGCERSDVLMTSA